MIIWTLTTKHAESDAETLGTIFRKNKAMVPVLGF